VTDGQKVAHFVVFTASIIVLASLRLPYWQSLLAAVVVGLVVGAVDLLMIRRDGLRAAARPRL
jgi:hypothetical protein